MPPLAMADAWPSLHAHVLFASWFCQEMPWPSSGNAEMHRQAGTQRKSCRTEPLWTGPFQAVQAVRSRTECIGFDSDDLRKSVIGIYGKRWL